METGRLAESDGEIVLEKRYAEEHKLQTGDCIQVGGKEFEITGVISSPDYDAPYKDFTDSSVNSFQFGTAFVSEGTYAELLAEGKSVKAEEYVYSYLLDESVNDFELAGLSLTDAELKDKLQELKVSADEIEDIYFQEYWEEKISEKVELEEGIQDLKSGAEELSDGLSGLTEIKTGMIPLDEGIASASDGAVKLEDGITELKEKTDEFLDENFDFPLSLSAGSSYLFSRNHRLFNWLWCHWRQYHYGKLLYLFFHTSYGDSISAVSVSIWSCFTTCYFQCG